MKFKYSGYDRAAKVVNGEFEASNEADARAKLRSLQVRPLKLVGSGRSGGGPSAKSKSANIDIGALLGANNPRPAIHEFTAFIRQLATMQGAGIPIVQSLGVLAEQVENKNFGKCLFRIQKMIEEGASLTDALRKYPDVFDKIFVNLIAAGEMSGSLEAILNRLSIYYEKVSSLRRKVKSAMTYPILTLVVTVVVIVILMMFVVPTFASMFASSGKALPGPTQLILDISNAFREYWYIVFGGIGAAVYGIIFSFKDESTRRKIDPLLLTLPIFGPLLMKIGIARFARTLGTMIQSGVPILDALEITSKVAGNYAIEGAIDKTRKSISQGNTIAGPLGAANVFPKMAVSMIAIGEQTGALDQMLTKVAEFYEDEVDAAVSSLTSILEPLMIVVVGVIVASVLIPMYLPIFKMGEAMSG